MQISNTKKSAFTLISIFLVSALLLCIGGNLLYRYQKKNITFEKHNELTAIGKLKVDLIMNWRNERLSDARSLFRNRTLISQIDGLLKGGNYRENYRAVKNWSGSLSTDIPDCTLILLSDSHGKTIFNNNLSAPMTGAEEEILKQAKAEGKIVCTDLKRYSDRKFNFDIAVPLYLDPRKHLGLVGAALLRIDPYTLLYTDILKWPTSSLSSEIYLARREGDSVLYLTGLNLQRKIFFNRQIALSDKFSFVVQAFKGDNNIIEGTDPKGIRVLGDIIHVPDSEWYIITKINSDEIAQPIIALATWIIIIVILLIMVEALLIFAVWRHQLNKSDRDRLALLQHFDYLVKYANDIIILSDIKGNIYEVNDKAISSYNYTSQELVRMNLSQLQPSKTNDVLEQQLLSANEKEGFRYESIQMGKDNNVFPVEISGRIMNIKNRKYIQLIIRDITERKKAEEEISSYQQHLQELVDEQTLGMKKLNLQLHEDIAGRKLVEAKLRESEQRLSFHFENSPLAVVELNADALITQWNKEAERIFGWKASETIGKTLESLEMVYEQDIPAVSGVMDRLTSGNENVVISSNRNYTKTGELIDCVWYNSILLDESSKMVSVMSLVEDITDRKKAENDLRKLSWAVEQSPVSIVITDLNGIIEYSNPKVSSITGYTPEELKGKRSNLFKSGETPVEVYAELWEAISAGKEWQGEFHNRKKNGELYWEAASISPIMDVKGNITHFMAIKEDITHRKIVEAELKKAKTELEIRVQERTAELAKSEERFRSTLDNLIEGCMFIGYDWKFIYINDATTKQFHQSRDYFIGHDLMHSLSDKKMVHTVKGFKVSMELRRHNHFVEKVDFADGTVKWFDFHVEPVSEGIFVMSSDITERIRAEKALKAQSLYHKNLLEASLDPLVTIGPDGKITDVNAATEKVTGYPREKLIGTDFSECFTDPESARRGYQEMFRKGSVHDFPLEIRHQDGHVTSVIYNASLYKDENGKVAGAVAAAHDVTEQKRIIDKLRASREGFRILAESIPQFVWIAKADGTFNYFNQRWVEYTGLKVEESLGEEWLKPFHPVDKQIASDKWQASIETGEKYDLTSRLRKYDGEYHWFVIRGVPIYDRSKKIVNWYGTCTDIDSQKQVEREIKKLNDELEQRVYERTFQLQNANKELEAFSYSVSHDLRAPLRSIDGWSMALLEDCFDQLDQQGRGYLTRVRTETQRMGILIDDLLKLSRVSRTEMTKEKVDLSALAWNIANRLLKTISDKPYEVIIHPGMVAEGDPNMLDIALTNLFDNAFKFSSLQAKPRIEFGQSKLKGKPVYWIKDNGVGFDMSYSKNLFGAFQRMHKQSEFPGTGVGLATVQRIISRHDGRIWAESTVNKGTTFYFSITY
ncbi:MAG: PAS domain S-box protein [Bacteroidota bacterium]|nr:PAS domain S-box protein [Bacteroidota bacterium]